MTTNAQATTAAMDAVEKPAGVTGRDVMMMMSAQATTAATHAAEQPAGVVGA